MKFVAWLSGMLAATDPAPIEVDPEKAPVVVVHGLDGNERHMERLARALRAEGRETFVPHLTPSDGSVPIEQLSAQLEAYIAEHLEGRQFDLVGYSMGGLITRHYLQRRHGIGRVRQYITLSSPHRGTLDAYLRPGEGLRQMRPRSEFLKDLNTDADLLRQLPFTSFWTITDLIIVPGTSSRMPQADNRHMLGLGHFSFIIEKRGIRRVLQVLRDRDDN